MAKGHAGRGGRDLTTEQAKAMQAQRGTTTKIQANKNIVTEILQIEFNMDPARVICQKLNEMEELYQSRKATLSFNDSINYYKLYIATMERIQPYVYSKRALEFKSEKTDVKVDYNAMIEQLNTKAETNKVVTVSAIDKHIDNMMLKVVADQ